MNDSLPEYVFFIALAVVVSASALISGSLAGYINVILLLLFSGILIITRTWKDRGFYLVCGAEPLVIACTVTNLWAGLFSLCMVAGIICRAFGLLESRPDLRPFLFFCGSSFLIALLIRVSNHVLVPLIIFGGITGVILAIRSVRTYQFRKEYTGA
jgi:hypothetical protein